MNDEIWFELITDVTQNCGCAARCAERLCLSGYIIKISGGYAAHVEAQPQRFGKCVTERHSLSAHQRA